MTPALLINLLAILLPILAVSLLIAPTIKEAIMLQSAFSILAALLYLLLSAPDVALTEAAINAAVATIIFLSATRQIEQHGLYQRNRVILVFALIALVLLAILFLELPEFAAENNPHQQHLMPFYQQQTKELIGIPNLVAAILASFRGFDTWGEASVIFTAALGISTIFNNFNSKTSIKRSNKILVHQQVTKLLLPLMLLSSAYIYFFGEYSPGGGFQAGAMLAAMIMAIKLGLNKRLILTKPATLLKFSSLGVLIYGFIGVFAWILSLNFMNYYALISGSPLLAQKIGIMLIEFGVTITVCASLVLIVDYLWWEPASVDHD